MKKVVLLPILLGAMTSFGQTVLADPLDDAIKARRSFYQVVLFNAAPLFGMAKGKIPYDAKSAQTYADNLKDLSELDNSAMWPKGSDNTAKAGKTRAKPEIWSEYPKVVEAAKAWKKAIKELADDADDGLDDLRPKVAALGEACSGCHKPFRAKEF
jgi:cytochrome c556